MLAAKGKELDINLAWMRDVGVCYQLPQKDVTSTEYLFPSLGVPKGAHIVVVMTYV